MSASPLAPVDPTERMSAEDMATRREEEHRELALAEQRRRAVVPGTPGTCSNCGASCGASTVFCDADCRQDFEARLAARRRAGGAATR